MKLLWIFTTLFFGFIINSCDSGDERKLPSVLIESIQVEEGNTTNYLEVLLTLTNSVDYDLSVDVRTVDGTAIKGKDYTDLYEIIIFSAGEEQASFAIEIIGDNIPEDNEIFSIRLENPQNVKIDNSIATVTIINDDEHIFFIPETGYTLSLIHI